MSPQQKLKTLIKDPNNDIIGFVLVDKYNYSVTK